MNDFELVNNCADVSCLLTFLRTAERNKDAKLKRAVLEKLIHMHVLCEPTVGEAAEYVNLRKEVADILGVKDCKELIRTHSHSAVQL